jgi:hypothetical protein
LHRDQDVTGVSGTGVVADGVEFDDGTVVIRWRGERPSTVVWEDLSAAEAVHGHVGATRFVFLGYDGQPLGEAPEPPERTARGFGHYLTAQDTYGKRLDVTESSVADYDAVWIYADEGAAHLDAGNAVAVRDALNSWLHSIDHPATRR